MRAKTVVFDAYGTLFDVAGAARQAADTAEGAALAQVWPALAETWRRKQLEYTWQRAITGHHTDFAAVTADALDWALEAQGLQGQPALRRQLLSLYDRLPAFPEAPAALRDLRAQGLRLAILSNGTPAMLHSAVAAAGLGGLFEAVLSVESAGIFKPATAAYDLVAAHLHVAPQAVLFVSSNGWDAAGAAGHGFDTAWINRAGAPVDRLPHQPARILSDLSALPALFAPAELP